ncbi:unnamed protein product [Strongylus vulgaris]|uniref:Uncharacterized protein n=1 Tax=Strongylus vulgaris TaxID=40348 RepID=A0A3P7IYW3_STRVU|nr:unnamed protein product [Strongylus vulgaris]
MRMAREKKVLKNADQRMTRIRHLGNNNETKIATRAGPSAGIARPCSLLPDDALALAPKQSRNGDRRSSKTCYGTPDPGAEEARLYRRKRQIAKCLQQFEHQRERNEAMRGGVLY